MRTFGAALLATSLVVSSAFAAPLSPGKPAGVKKAQAETNWLVLLGVAGIVGVGIGVAASNPGSNSSVINNTSTGSGSTP
jgi:hypothetical protein